MPNIKDESFSFGGVDSRSNPANYPTNRALRCINFTPQSSGALRLRAGYTVPSGSTADSIAIHSMIYYEQFSASYLGPQYVLIGKGASVDVYNMVTGQTNLAPNDKTLPAPSLLAATDGGAGGILGAGTYFYEVTALDGMGGETN